MIIIPEKKFDKIFGQVKNLNECTVPQENNVQSISNRIDQLQ